MTHFNTTTTLFHLFEERKKKKQSKRARDREKGKKGLCLYLNFSFQDTVAIQKTHFLFNSNLLDFASKTKYTFEKFQVEFSSSFE